MDLDIALKVFEVSNIDGLDLESLKITYKNLAKIKHPDRNGGNSKDFVKLKEAYVTLQKEVVKSNSTGRKLKTLSKDELLDVYYNDTGKLRLQINLLQEQTEDTLQETRIEVERIINEFEEKRKAAQEEVKQNIEKSRQEFNKSLLNKFLFFWPNSRESDFWKKYDEELAKHSKRQTELDMEFYQIILDIYGRSLNEISQIINNNDTRE